MGVTNEKATVEKTKKNNIEIWEDLVRVRDLIISLCICSITTLSAYFIAPNAGPTPLFFGLVGALLGFIITSLLIKPKRTIIITESRD